MLDEWTLTQVRRSVDQYNLQSPVLDVGAAGHHVEMRELFVSTGRRYWAVDRDGSEGVDIIAVIPRERLPMIHDIKTALILTMLEHAFVPNSVVKWTTSKLAVGGRILVCANKPSGTALDLWRFMPDGINWLLRDLNILEVTLNLQLPTSECRQVFAVAERIK